MLLLMVLKMAATSITAGSGGSGGVSEEVGVRLLPSNIERSGHATVGMAAAFAAASRGPITSTLILVEMTDDFDLMAPLLIAITAATLVSQLLSQGTIYSVKAGRLGVVVVDGEAEPSNVVAQLRVSDAMAQLMESFGPTATLDEITLAFEGDPDPIALVVRENGDIHGIITDFRLTEDAVIVASATRAPR